MGRPTAQEIAGALGINSNQLAQLQKRGMPVHQIKKAREWFAEHGFNTIHHGKSGGSANNGPNMETKINSIIGKGRGVMPLKD